MGFFKSPSEIVLEMLQDWKSITGEDFQPTDLGREEVIKVSHAALAISHFRSDLQRAYDDIFPGSASIDGLIRHLAARELPGRREAQQALGTIHHTGTVGTTIPQLFQMKRKLDGKVYISRVSSVVGEDGTVDVPYASQISGQDQNIDLLAQEFDAVSTITGLDATGTNTTTFADGRDLETPEEMLARIQAHDQSEDTGGNLAAYERLALEADTSVVNAHAIKNPRGPGTVNTVITSGTTDIAGAVAADVAAGRTPGESVVRVPSDALIAAVQAYVIANNPTTDDHLAVKPTEITKAITVTYALYNEELRAQVDAVIDQVTAVFLYSALSGETIYPAGLERAIDAQVGYLISSRRVSDLGAGTPGYTLPGDTILKPGVITKAGP